MQLTIDSGKYIVAVSGGVDSVTLLHILSHIPELELIVAHFDHGIRDDSELDRRLVEKLAASYNLPFTYGEGRLGKSASEATARNARYDFLRQARRDFGAQAIVTAHHRDDVVETAFINLMRGTGRKGLSSLADSTVIRRPMLHFTKKDIADYARQHKLEWRDDNTNVNEQYLRNYIRNRIIPKMCVEATELVLQLISRNHELNIKIDAMLAEIFSQQPSADRLDRQWFLNLPYAVSMEVIAQWLRNNNVRSFNTNTLDRIVISAKTKPAGKLVEATDGTRIKITPRDLALIVRER